MKVQIKRWMAVGLVANCVGAGGARAQPGDPASVTTVVDVGAFVETYGAWGAGPQREWRAFDAQSQTWAISLVAIEAGISGPIARGRLSLQAGPTAASLFLAEPTQAGAAGAAPLSGADLHNLREAWAGFALPGLPELTLDGGLFLSPVGYDSVAAKDNRFWSLSSLGFGLPFYFTGARATFSPAENFRVMGAVVNGWNSVVDNNRAKSGILSVGGNGSGGAKWQALSMVGKERGRKGVRGLLDLWGDIPIENWSLFGGIDLGLENNPQADQRWIGGQAGVERRWGDRWSTAIRAETFHTFGDFMVAPIFWPSPHLMGTSLNVGYRPTHGILVRLEGRWDQGKDGLFGTTPTPIPGQSGLTLGITGWWGGQLHTP
jgi:hypothetical protein